MNTLNALFLVILTTIVLFGWLRYENDKKFKIWFDAVKQQAPFHGFTKEDIEEFETIVWRQYFEMDYDVELAIKTYLSE